MADDHPLGAERSVGCRARGEGQLLHRGAGVQLFDAYSHDTEDGVPAMLRHYIGRAHLIIDVPHSNKEDVALELSMRESEETGDRTSLRRHFTDQWEAVRGLLPAHFGEITLVEPPDFNVFTDQLFRDDPVAPQVTQDSPYPNAPWCLEIQADIEEPHPKEVRWHDIDDQSAAWDNREDPQFIRNTRWDRKASWRLGEVLNLFQAVARLLHPSNASVIPYGFWSVDQTGTLAPFGGLPYMGGPQPEYAWMVEASQVDHLRHLIAFLKSYWLVASTSKEFQVPLMRFSQSIDRPDQTDRLVDLMIALEALYSEPGETSYKVAIRCASFVYPPGEARSGAFQRLRKFYDQRSDVLHGRKVSSLTQNNLDLLEDHVGRSLVKVLDQLRDGQPYPKPADFDRYVLFPWKS